MAVKSSRNASTGKIATNRPAARSLATKDDSAAGDWRIVTLAEARRIITLADPDIVEERKWIKPINPVGVAVWSRSGIVCTGETYKQIVKLTFARGASLKDPHALFNSSLEGSTRRAIDIGEGEVINASALTALVRAAVAENLSVATAKSKKRKSSAPTQEKSR